VALLALFLGPEATVLVKAGTMALGTAISEGAKLFGWYNERQAELQSKGYQVLNQVYTDIRDSFGKIQQAGGNLAGGMTELITLTTTAGVQNTKIFADAVSQNMESVRRTGLGFDETANRLAAVSNKIRGTKLGEQLDKLGYTTQEQLGLMIDVMSNLNQAGDRRVRSDKELADLTVQYGKDLKALQEITQGDVRAKMRDAQRAMAAPALQAMADELGPEFAKRATGVVKTLGEYGKLGQDMMSALKVRNIAGGGADFMAAYRRDPEIKALYDQMRAYFMEGRVGGKAVSTDTGEQAALQAEDIAKKVYDRQRAAETGATTEQKRARTGRVVTETLAAGSIGNVGTLATQLEYRTNLAMRAQDLGNIEAEKKAAADAADNQKKLDANAAKARERTEKAGAGQLKTLSKTGGALETFSDRMDGADDAVTRFKNDLNDVNDWLEKLKPGLTKTGYNMADEITGGVNETTSAATASSAGTATSAATGVNAAMASSLINFTNNSGDQAHFSLLAPPAQSAFLNMSQEFNTATGKKLTLTSGARTPEEQADLYNRWVKAGGNYSDKPTAAGITTPTRPGAPDPHVEGRAIDISRDDYRALMSLEGGALLKKYGFQSVKGDEGHLQLPRMETGGVTEGPTLAGEGKQREAVVPLPDGRTIPVSMDWSEIIEKFDRMISIMSDQHHTSSKILRASV
jgi:hypothetical protein